MTMGTINSVVSNKFTDKVDKARAIYYWIAHNISYDVKAARTNSNTKNTPDEVLQYRKAVGLGFASLLSPNSDQKKWPIFILNYLNFS